MGDPSEVRVTDRFSLKDKNFLITGGARGIGFGAVKAIAQLGGGVAVIDALEKPVDEFETLAKKYNVKTSYHRGDVTDPKSLETAFEASVKAMGGHIHGGLAAAGVNLDEPLIDATWEKSQFVINVNVLGTIWTAKLIAKHLVETKKPGSIVCIASLSGQGVHIPTQHVTVYNASKAAIKGCIGPMAVELGKYGIRVNSISPGAIHSPMTAALEKDAPNLLQWFKDAAPVGRMGEIEDLTTMICFLLSEAASFMTGADVPITGGIHVGRNDYVIPNEGPHWLQKE